MPGNFECNLKIIPVGLARSNASCFQRLLGSSYRLGRFTEGKHSNLKSKQIAPYIILPLVRTGIRYFFHIFFLFIE